MRKMVLLPQPLMPMMQWKEPGLHGKAQAVDDVEVLDWVLVGDLLKFQHGMAHRSRVQAISQKPSSYRLQLTKISSSRRYSASVQPSASWSISSTRASLVFW